jgi:transposase
MGSWRAGCGGTRTSGSGVRTEETNRRKAENALRSDTHYWAADLLQAEGARVHLIHPLGLHWDSRRVKNDVKDATELANRLRRNDIPEAWIAPPEVRELRELVRYRAKLTALRTSAKAQIHAVMAKLGILPPMTEMFGPGGQKLLDAMEFPGPYGLRVESLRDLLEIYDRELTMVEREIARWLKDDPGYHAIQALHGIGPITAAILVAEIGDVHRFPTARHLCSWAGMTPKLHESDTTTHRGRITKMACGAASLVGTAWLLSGGEYDDHRWAGYPSSSTDIRLRGHDHRRGSHGQDRSCQPGTVAQMVRSLRRVGRSRLCVGGLHGLAVCRGGNGGSRGHSPCGRTGGDSRFAGKEE